MLTLSRVLLACAVLATLSTARAQMPPDSDTAPGELQQGLNKPYPVFTMTDVHAVPSSDGPVIGLLWPQVDVLVTGLVAEGEWAQVQLPDGKTVGYVPADAIPAAVDQTPPDLPKTVAGHPIVRDTATLVIDRRNVHLSKLEGTDGPLADSLQSYISSAGGTVSCEERELGYYLCTMPDGTDLALVALVNGAALAADGAPDAYLRQQAVAQQAHRGIWALASAPN